MKRRDFLRMTGTGLALAAGAASGAKAAAGNKRNVLFIAVDDLRPELGCYGNAQIKSPNIDRLGRGGVVFDRAYCQVAVCNPSRASLMTGLRPDSAKVWDLRVHFRDTVPDVVTLPQHFRRHGYSAVAYGKIFHNPLPDPRSWDEPNHWPKKSALYSDETREQLQQRRDRARAEGKSEDYISGHVRGPATEAEDVPDNRRGDGELAEGAIAKLGELAGRKQPFFLAVGFILPHLPFTPPKKYWDLYDPAKIPEAENPFPPKGAPAPALNTMYELRAYGDFADTPPPQKGTLTEPQRRRLKHGYYASVTFIDTLIGRLLDALERSGVADDTVVVLWGDHGWKLGEHGSWCKQTNYETDTRAPLMFRAPGVAGQEKRCDAPVEFVDVYPTVCELAGLPAPPHLEGKSLAPLLQQPDRPWTDAAYSQFIRRHEKGFAMGRALRTRRHRFVEWRHWASGEPIADELYDQLADPRENTNIAAHPTTRSLVEELRAQLHEVLPVRNRPGPATIYSKRTKNPIRLEITNNLREPVVVYWIDYFGSRKRVAAIKPTQKIVQNTHQDHTFIIESATGAYHRAIVVEATSPHLIECKAP